MAELFLIRHGQAAFGSKNYDQLTELGFKQSQLLGKYFATRTVSFNRIFVGPLNRHQQTLDSVLLELPGDQDIVQLYNLDEFKYSELYRAYVKYFPNDKDVLATHANDHKNPKIYYSILNRALGAWAENTLGENLSESWQAFSYRISNMMIKNCNFNGKGEKVLIITSAGVIAMMLREMLDLSDPQTIKLNMQLRNTSVTHCYYSGGDYHLSSFNCVPHLHGNDNVHAITLY